MPRERDIRILAAVLRNTTQSEKVIDVQALAGDPVDNVPGVPGIGIKTAAKLINQFGSLDLLYDHLDHVARPRLRMLLAQHEDQARLCRDLVRLRTDVRGLPPVESLRNPWKGVRW